MKKIKNKSLMKEEVEAHRKVLYWFFSYPTREMSLTDLSLQLKISKTTANRVVTELIKEGFLKKEILGRIWRLSCNFDHPHNFYRKIPFNLSLVNTSGIINEVHKLIKNPRVIILFGSYRKGDDTEDSDLDIAVEVLGEENTKIIELGVLNNLGYRKNVPVNLHVFSKKKVDVNLFSNIANGIVLDGFLEVKP
jgi:predicted nucleotidyltransferase